MGAGAFWESVCEGRLSGRGSGQEAGATWMDAEAEGPGRFEEGRADREIGVPEILARRLAGRKALA